MGFPPMTTDTAAGILGKVNIVLTGVPTRLRAPKQLVRSRQRLGGGGGLVAKGGLWEAAATCAIGQEFREHPERDWERSQRMQAYCSCSGLSWIFWHLL